jgi:hypothetical protein
MWMRLTQSIGAEITVIDCRAFQLFFEQLKMRHMEKECLNGVPVHIS